jgi:hypothetical protein
MMMLRLVANREPDYNSLIMPRMLRRLHQYVEQGSIALFLGCTTQFHVIYEKSIWGALEDPVRYLITFMAF